MAQPIDPRVTIGHVHLKVADLERAVAFYSGVLGFEVTQRWQKSAAFLSAGGYHHHIGLNIWESRDGAAPPPGTTGLYHFAIRYPDRASLGDALRRLVDARIPLEGAADHGVSEALYLRDPDGNGIELYWDRPQETWPRLADGSVVMGTEPLDVQALLADARTPAIVSEESPAPGAPATPRAESLSDGSRDRLRTLRQLLIALHKALLDDATAAYEMDRGRVGSAGNLLQLVIHDPWFAWLRQISELIVRIDEAASVDGAATEADARTLVDQVDSLLVPSEHGDAFACRYFEALQRQPGVVLAHAAVRRALKGSA